MESTPKKKKKNDKKDKTKTQHHKKESKSSVENHWDIVDTDSIAKADLGEALTTLEQISLSGQVQKWTNYMTGWKKRFFSLKGGIFKYSTRKREIGVQYHSVNIKNATILKLRGKNCRFVVDTGRVVLHLRTKSPEKRDQWIAALVKTKSLLKKISELGGEKDKTNSLAMQAKLKRMKATLQQLQQAKVKIQESLDLRNNKVSHSRSKSELRSSDDNTKKKEEVINLASELCLSAGKIISDASDMLLEHVIVTNSMIMEIHKLKEKNRRLTDITNNNLTKPINRKTRQKEVGNSLPNKLSSYSNPLPHSSTTPEIQTLPKEREEESAKSSSEYFDALDWEDQNSEDTEDNEDSDFFSDLSKLEDRANKKTDTSLQKNYSKENLFLPGSEISRPSLVSSLVNLKILLPITSQVALDDTLRLIPNDFVPRTSLPKNRINVPITPLDKILINTVGQDLTKIAINVEYMEPLSMLQRLSEDFEYADLLNKAVKIQDPCLRLAYVAAFAVSGYSSTFGRTTKPFNPIIGETFDLFDSTNKFRLFTEQVCVSPPISAWISEGIGWTIWGHTCVESIFWGKSMEVHPNGSLGLSFPDTGDKFVWNKVNTIINKNTFIDHAGDMILINQSTGDKCKIVFSDKTKSISIHNVEGIVYTNKNKPKYKLEGSWSTFLTAIPYDDSGKPNYEEKFCIWSKMESPLISSKQYGFTYFAMKLGQIVGKTLSTDSRLRPDIQALEMGELDKCAQYQELLSKRQQIVNEKLKVLSVKWKPRWFKEDPKERSFIFKGGYWEAKQKQFQNMQDIPDIFNTQTEVDSIIQQQSKMLSEN